MKTLLLLAAVMLAGCSQATTTPEPTPTTVASPTPAASPTPNVVTPRPATPTPKPRAEVNQVAVYLLPWKNSINSVWAQLIVELKNTGETWVEIDGWDSDYAIYDTNGDVLETGGFSYEYPRLLAPGETGYLAEDILFNDSVRLDDIGRAEANSYFTEADERDAIELTVDRIKNLKEDYGDGWYTTGTITNASDEDVDDAQLGAFYLDADGHPLGYSMTNLIENLAAGQTKAFETITFGGIPINGSDIVTTLVFASPTW